MKRKVTVRHDRGNTGSNQEVHAETVEQALKDLAKQVKKGEIEPPFALEFEGPGGLQFNVTVTSADDVHEISTMGFMF